MFHCNRFLRGFYLLLLLSALVMLCLRIILGSYRRELTVNADFFVSAASLCLKRIHDFLLIIAQRRLK